MTVMVEQDGPVYSKFVAKLAYHPTQDIDGNVLHMALGVMTEAGELADAIKRFVGYSLPFDRGNVIEEIGDCLFYLQGLCGLLDITLVDAIELNIKKLQERYPDGYSQEAAVARKDKQDGEETGANGI